MMSLAEFKGKMRIGAWPDDYDGEQPLEFLWCFPLNAKPEDMWFYLADTSRFNREMNFAKRSMKEENGRNVVTTTMMGVHQQWIEEPWTWIAGQTVSMNRIYLKGMAKYVRGIFHVEPRPDSGKCHVYIYFGWFPKNPLWKLWLQVTENIVKNKMRTVFEKVVKFLELAPPKIEKREALKVPISTIPVEGSDKLKRIREQLTEKGLKADVIDHLIRHVESGDEMELDRLKIIPLAKRWNISKRDLLITCLHATRLGMFNLSWDVICPHCRGTRLEAKSLGDLPGAFDCDVCRIDFKTDRTDSIEVTFHVQPSVRKIEAVSYCAAEPTKKEHIRVQQNVEAGSQVTVSAI
ncbi:MAG: DUF5939 domain-containing protein, partial [Bdellovibrionia bacterium]